MNRGNGDRGHLAFEDRVRRSLNRSAHGATKAMVYFFTRISLQLWLWGCTDELAFLWDEMLLPLPPERWQVPRHAAICIDVIYMALGIQSTACDYQQTLDLLSYLLSCTNSREESPKPTEWGRTAGLVCHGRSYMKTPTLCLPTMCHLGSLLPACHQCSGCIKGSSRTASFLALTP